jgi:predicted RNA-binding Zn-ribbon protein involved in translation (DUF1610 family)
MRYLKDFARMFESSGNEGLIAALDNYMVELKDIGMEVSVGETNVHGIDAKGVCLEVVYDTKAGIHDITAAKDFLIGAVGVAEDHGKKIAGNKDSYVEVEIGEEICPSCGSYDVVSGQKYERGRSYYECKDCGETGDDDDFISRYLDIESAEDISKAMYWKPIAITLVFV